MFVPPRFVHGFAGLVMPANATEPSFLTSALSILFILNLLLGTFNLLPVPPLDGSSGIMVVLPEGLAHRYLDFMQHSRNFAMLGLLVAWNLFDRIFQPIFLFALHMLYSRSSQRVTCLTLKFTFGEGLVSSPAVSYLHTGLNLFTFGPGQPCDKTG